MENKKAPSSFVPTLTEVVQPEAVPGLRPPAAAQDALVAELLQRLLPEISNELQTAVREAVDAHMQTLLPQLTSQIDDAVRVALSGEQADRQRTA